MPCGIVSASSWSIALPLVSATSRIAGRQGRMLQQSLEQQLVHLTRMAHELAKLGVFPAGPDK